MYNNRAWQEYSRRFIRGKACVLCLQAGRVEPAKVTDHTIPHCGNMDLFNDPNNHQPLCISCHNRKTVNEQRGATGQGKAGG